MSKQPTIALIESLFDTSKDYAENRLELIRLKAIGKSVSIISKAISLILIIVVFVIFFLTFSIGLGFLIGDWVGRPSWGFLLLAAFYLIVGLVLMVQKGRLIKMFIGNKLILQFFNSSTKVFSKK